MPLRWDSGTGSPPAFRNTNRSHSQNDKHSQLAHNPLRQLNANHSHTHCDSGHCWLARQALVTTNI